MYIWLYKTIYNQNLMNRRNLLKTLSLTVGASIVGTEVLAKIGERSFLYNIPDNPNHKSLDKPVTAITIGAGNRGMVYGGFAAKFTDQIKIIGVAEPNSFRNDRYAKIHNIPAENRFNTWEDVFKRPKFADAVIISTPDNLHYEPCMKALAMGYDIL